MFWQCGNGYNDNTSISVTKEGIAHLHPSHPGGGGGGGGDTCGIK